MCGIIGIYGNDYVAQDVYDGLVTLQHRGQDAAGMVTFDGKFHVRKAIGLVKDVFHTRHMIRLTGYAGIGFNRYATIGTGGVEEVMPFIGAEPYGVILAHNGNLFNSKTLKKEIFEKDHRMVNSESDGEVMLNLFSKSLAKVDLQTLSPEHIWDAVKSVHARAQGAYSVISYIAKQGMVAFRDPHGIRPLVFGKRKNGLLTEYIFASESVTLDILGYEMISDVKPGEAIFIDEKERKVHRKRVTIKEFAPCIFEYVYFARPDSILNEISVYKSNLRMGERLAQKIREFKLDIDVVMPVPDSSRPAAIAIAEKLGIIYREGLVKNRYIGRTFIMPGQKVRRKNIRYKLNPMPLEIKDKNVLLVDDSIVRGNTSRQIVEMVRNSGAKKVYFATFYPPVISPCLYGVDIPTKEELIAADSTIEEVEKFIAADKLIYAGIKDVFESCIAGNPKLKRFCMACIDKDYVTGDVTAEVIRSNADARLAEKRCGGIDEESDIVVEPHLIV